MPPLDVHYKPLAALKPAHLVVIGLLDGAKTLGQIERELPLPSAILHSALEDLLAWGLAENGSFKFQLTHSGSQCRLVWLATDKTGRWSFADDGSWLLGKGKFSFRPPISCLEEASLDCETGKIITVRDATKLVRSFFHQRQSVERDICENIIQKKLAEGANSDPNVAKLLRELLAGAATIRQLTQLSRQALSALSELFEATSKSPEPADSSKVKAVQEAVPKMVETIRWAIKKHEKAFQSASRILVADWLSKREGLLKSLAVESPSSLLVVSDCGDIILEYEAIDEEDDSPS